MPKKNKAKCPAASHAKRRKVEKKVDDGNKCTWGVGTDQKDPHHHEEVKQEPLILDSILDHIGNTPMVRLNRIPQSEGVKCEVLAKCEYFNAGGSVKDRIGKRMVLDAEKEGRIQPGDTLIEPTSGNTGIGLALAAAIRGYRMVITLPEKMSQEKVDVLKGLGAEIYRTPTEAAFDSPDSHIGVAKRLNVEIKNSHILDQYSNPANPLAHYDGTAEEIIKQCGGKVDYIVAGAGTGGTISGIARKIKEKIPSCRIIGVDPVGSILALPESLNGEVTSYQVEGIGYDFIPKVLDRNVVDEWVKSEDKPSFVMSRRLIREEGLLCGGSSGTAVQAAIEYAKKHNLPASARMVVILPDSVRNYMSKFLNDGWMIERGFMQEEKKLNGTLEQWLDTKRVSDLRLTPPLTVLPTVTCGKCVKLLQQHGYDQMPVVNADGDIQGMVTLGNLQAKLISGRIQRSDPIKAATFKQFRKVSLNSSLYDLHRVFERDHFALVVSEQRCIGGEDEITKSVIVGVVARIDLLHYMVSNAPADAQPAATPTA